MSFGICFVCTGNACRSPFAACVTRRLLAEAGRTDFEVWSCGTLDWGENPRDAGMAEVAREMGYEMEGTTAHMTREGLMAADVVIVFDKYQRNAVTSVLDYARWDRIALFNRIALDEAGAVEDPHSKSPGVYRRVAEHIERGCRRLVERWLAQGPGAAG